MDFSLSEEQQSLRSEIVRFARGALNEGVLERDRTQIFPHELWRKCGEMGLHGLPVPVEEGGVGLDPVSCAVALEALGYGCHDGGLVFSLCAHLVACVVPIWKYGDEKQKRRFLPGLCDGSLIGAHAMSESDSGSDAFSMRTRAERDGDGFCISGTKMFVSNGPLADVMIVFAVTDPQKRSLGGITAFIVEKGVPGLRCGSKIEKMGLRTSHLGEVVLDGVHVGEDAVLGGVGGGAGLFAQSMNWERALLFASHVGTMDRLLEKCIGYARSRTQFGQHIGKFQAVAHRIADLRVDIEAARLLAYRAAWSIEHDSSAVLNAAIAKLFISEALVRAAQSAVQVHGGYGYTTEFELERALRDAVGSTLYSGTSEMQRNIIARWLGL